MNFKLPFKSTSYEPEVVAQLEALREVELNNLQQGQHHPIDMYAIAFFDVWGNLNDLLEIVNEVTEKQLYLPGNSKQEWEKNLKMQLDHTLDAFVQFFDSCRAIIKICSEPEKKTKAIRRFNDAIEDLTDRFIHAVNKIKHEQRVLQVVYFHNPRLFIPGYFIEGVVDAGVIGPDPALHKGANTAFSLYRDIPILVCAIYLASSVLAEEVTRATKLQPANLGDRRGINDEKITAVLKKISLLPLTFFPDEAAMLVPLVRYMSGTETLSSRAELEFPTKRLKAKTIATSCQVSTSCSVRSVARTIKMPYWMNRGE